MQSQFSVVQYNSNATARCDVDSGSNTIELIEEQKVYG